MVAVNLGPHPSVTERFNNAKELYEGVVERKGSWYENRTNATHYQDEKTQEQLLIAGVRLVGVEAELRERQHDDQLSVHLAAVYWQRALVRFLSGDHIAAADDLQKMRVLIPRFPKGFGVWRQKATYLSEPAPIEWTG